jgi:signal transduction histidine kinase
MRLPGGIRAQLTLALLAIVGGALAAAYLMVVPSLERRLVDAKLDQLQRNAERTAASVVSSSVLSDRDLLRSLGAAFGARVVVYQVLGPPLSLGVLQDSVGTSPGTLARDPVALEAALSGTARGRVERDGVEYGEAAIQLFTGEVLLLSGSLADQLATVALVKRRLLYATGVALLVVLVLGSAAAGAHARRIRRIERAANRIAEGAFDEPLVDDGRDELADLASAFDRMRLQLAQLDTARKEFVANASHELRTPLFSLAGFLELMADEELDEETRAGFLATTREQVERLTRLSANLLDLSRMDAGRLHVANEEVGLAEVAQSLADELEPIAEATGHRLVVEADGEAWARADEERVAQIGRALVGNALAHTPTGTTVTLAATRRGDAVALSVSDDGPGIPPAHLERIFDRFYRVDGSQASGSGLGLAIARELADRMDGTVTVESAPGRTVFTLALPAEATQPAPA